MQEPRRADARRNRERILVAAAELFARGSHQTQMEQIAAHAGLGMGTLYRHFPNKRALLTAIVRERFAGMWVLARAAEEVQDPGDAFETLLRTYLEAAEGDAGFQLAMLGSDDLEWEGIQQQKAELAAVVTRIIERAVAAGAVRSDLTYDDFPVLTCAVMSTMYFRPSEGADWRRHLDLVLTGVRVRTDAPQPQGLASRAPSVATTV